MNILYLFKYILIKININIKINIKFMKYFKLFKDHNNDYVPYINSENCILPNVSYCKNQNEIHINKFDYSRCYLTFTALESGTISFNI